MTKKEKAKTPTEAEMQAYVSADYTAADIATAEGWSVAKVRYWLKKFDLKASIETKSIGHKAFRTLLQKEFPAYPIKEEYHVGNRLMVDFYIPSIHLAFEIDGKQHQDVNNMFHSGSEEVFLKQMMRDLEKEERCGNKGILLIRVSASVAEKALQNEVIAEQIFKNARDKLAAHEPPDKDVEIKHTPDRYSKYREKMKQLGKEARQRNYKKTKEIKRRRDTREHNSKRTAFRG